MNHKSDYINTELGMIPANWSYEILDNFLEWITYGFTNPMPTTTTGPFMITAKDIVNGRINYQTARHTDELAFKSLLTDKSRPNLNDVLITKDASIGRVAVVDTKGICINQSVALLRVNDRIKPYYLRYLLESPGYQKLIERDAGGSTIKHIYITRINKMLVGVPSIFEQRAILDVLRPIDDKIANNLAMNKTLEDMAMTLYKDWFVDFGPFQGEGFVDSELGMIPKGWEVKRIQDFGKISCGKTPSKKIESNYSSNGYPFIKIPDMHGNVFVSETNEYISEEGNKTQIKKLIPPGSVCVSCIATVGLVSINSNPSHTNQQINSIIPHFEFTRNYIYISMLNLKDRFLNEASGGSATLNMNTSTFSNIEFIYPDKKVLQNFDNAILNVFKKIESNQIENQTLTKLRDTLLPKLISGEVRVKDVEKTITEVL